MKFQYELLKGSSSRNQVITQNCAKYDWLLVQILIERKFRPSNQLVIIWLMLPLKA